MSARGTSNSNARGNAATRRARRQALVRDWMDAFVLYAARCVFCAELLDETSVTVDRIIPGILGGTYTRGNIRPACMHCNSVQGSELRDLLRAGHDFFGRSWPGTPVRPLRTPGRLLVGQRHVVRALVLDPRFSAARIAREVGVTPATVSRYRGATQ